MLSTISVSDMQAATHLKGLADKAKLNEKHVKIAQIYKARWLLLLLRGPGCRNERSIWLKK